MGPAVHRGAAVATGRLHIAALSVQRRAIDRWTARRGGPVGTVKHALRAGGGGGTRSHTDPTDPTSAPRRTRTAGRPTTERRDARHSDSAALGGRRVVSGGGPDYTARAPSIMRDTRHEVRWSAVRRLPEESPRPGQSRLSTTPRRLSGTAVPTASGRYESRRPSQCAAAAPGPRNETQSAKQSAPEPAVKTEIRAGRENRATGVGGVQHADD